ncbi:MAG: thioredoxin family protein [Bacteroidales bacterium]|nr:thioredoxin family protein [Bacteroidales bacterium]
MKRTARALCALLLLFTTALLAQAQIIEPVGWTTRLIQPQDGSGAITFYASIEPGWHLYGLKLPDGGPRPTSVTYTTLEGVELEGELEPSVAPKEEVDMVFHLKLAYWSEDVELKQRFRVTSPDGAFKIAGDISYQGCNDESCIAPAKSAFEFSSHATAASPSDKEDSPAPKITETIPDGLGGESSWWAPAVFPDTDETNNQNIAQSSWWYIFIWGFIGGLVALLTPCVWPMIPLTVSFFLKKGNSRSRSIGDALIYGGGIIVIYLALGLAITLIFGASKLNDLATNAVFNLLFFLLLLVFAISFFGAFDIKLPSKWSNGVDSKAERTTGIISIFFMAFTLVLVSFSCTGPIIGTLLVEAASVGNIAGPAIGMGAFALALAIPFTLFAIFPSWLKEMPRSGGWLNSVKVVLGFLELALSLKFLSVADLAYGWGILDREVFVSLWIIIFALLGFYLLGKIEFSHDSRLKFVGVARFFMALVSLSFSVYLIPGLWGAPLKSVSAFVPPLFTQDFNLYEGNQFKQFSDYEEGMRYAAEHGRPVLMDFSGFGCVNCRKMEGAVFDAPEIKEMIEANFVLIELMVDDKQKLAQPITVEENGRKVRLSTVGDKWSYLQRHKFAANSQPYYVVLNNQGDVMGQPYYYDENVAKFADWLQQNIECYQSAAR